MNVDLGIWQKLTRVVVFLLLLAVLIGVGVWYLPLIKQNERMRKEILRLDGELQKEKDANKQLRTSMNALQNDTNAVERVARETLRYARPGETVVVFENPATNTIVR